ncbi:MAG: AAA-like domain-containing protein [Bacteroidia bacterium]
MIFKINNSLIIALDNVDLLFESETCRNDFCKLLRSWNDQTKDINSDIWRKLGLIVVHSTEVYHTWDINSSPLSGIGETIDLKEFNSGQAFGFPGGEPATAGQFGSLLNNMDFNLLHIVVGATTGTPVLSLPNSLVTNTFWTAAQSVNNRTLQITNGNPGPNPIPFNFDNTSFNINVINKSVKLNAIEKWTIVNNNVFGHAFHIHDVEFKIVDRNGSAAAVGNYEAGWKDVVFVPVGESVSFVAKFDDYADEVHPFMYHCHFANHEDDGMMGQFVVVNNIAGLSINNTAPVYTLFPNPAHEHITILHKGAPARLYYAKIYDAVGRTVLMLPKPDLSQGLDISDLTPGLYTLELTDDISKLQSVLRFQKH